MQIGAVIMANACGPCIGQWKRHTDDPMRKNSIVTSFNRNFAKRADGNPNTYAFVASPELTMALTIAGDLCFNPLKDRLMNHDGEKVKLAEPEGEELPLRGFTSGNEGYIAPGGTKTAINVNPASQRLQLLTPFPAWDGQDILNMPLLIKAQGKCTTDHISMAGPWLRFRGHLENISDNMLMGAGMLSMAKRTTCGTVRQTPTEPFRAQPKCINPKESPPLSWLKKITEKAPVASTRQWNPVS